jgi:hypothetical protein
VTPRLRTIAATAIVLTAVLLGYVLFVALPRYAVRRPATTAVSPATVTPPATDERTIAATLYVVSEDGMALTGVKRSVTFGATVADQARQIVLAELTAAPPLVSPLPGSTRLRDVFVTDKGDAFVDLTGVAAAHSGGTLGEVLSVYAIVDVLTVNLPAITRVQILIDGKQVDTLAGHVDLRHPLAKNLDWIAHDTH